jgi:hypothetical protein
MYLPYCVDKLLKKQEGGRREDTHTPDFLIIGRVKAGIQEKM